MKAKTIKIAILGLFAASLLISSCIKDLDTIPLDEDVVTSASVYKKPENYINVLAKLYAGLAVSGQQGPSGNNDLSGLDEGFGQYLRAYWYAQELPTDEAVIAWNDGNLRDYHEQDWSSNNEFVANLYYRIYYQISLCNEFIRETATSKLDDRGFSQTDKDMIAEFRTEARFLRALSYWHALDMFGSVPFVTEDDAVGSFFPPQISRSDLFDYVESELLEIEDDMMVPMANDYARADQAALWMLLAKLYLNAEVYIDTPKYTESLTYVNKVIGAGYTLEPDFANLFLADNHNADGVIFPVAFDGKSIQTWGGTTFLVHAPVGGSMDVNDYGIDFGWGGLRVTKELVSKFMDISGFKSKTIKKAASTPYPHIYVPGSFQGWDPANENSVLADPEGDDTFEGYLYFADANTEFKFAAGPSWDRNWGDDGADLSMDLNGANIVAADAGYYKVNVDTIAFTYTYVKTDWGIIGDATADAWNSDQDMTYNPTDSVWEIVANLTAGEMKFRANDDWPINLGDNGADGVLEYDGSNIAVALPGTYLVKLKLGAPDYTYTIEEYASDSRSMFYTEGQELEINDVFLFTDGFAVTKWKNITSTGATGSDITHVDNDFPMFRLADAYLMYAEAVLRGGSGGTLGQAVSYINMLKERAIGNDTGNITGGDLDLDFILDERARELLWEGQRRTDLIRFGRFSDGDYLWAWKGGIMEGKTVDSKYDIYPIPASDVGANINLTQNPGY